MDTRLPQLDRAKRYLDRIDKLYSGKGIPYEDKNYHDDDVISFFIHCYHVKDWIIQANRINISKASVEDYINSHEPLKICADLCNGEKHFKLKKGSRTGRQPHIAYKVYSATEYTTSSGINSEIKGKYEVLSSKAFYDVKELASACIALWEEFIDMQVLSKTGKAKQQLPPGK